MAEVAKPPCILALFGCFNPPTRGHISAMKTAAAKLSELGYTVSKAIMVPAHGSYGKAGLTSAKDRLEMCRLAAEDEDLIGAEDVEVKKETWPRTVRILDELKEIYAGHRLFLLCGLDVFRSFESKWREGDVVRIADEYGIVVMERGIEHNVDLVACCSWLNGHMQNVIYIASNEFGLVSSTKVRDAIAKGESVDDLLTPKVKEYIAASGLYNWPQ
jgi:nicotinate (nicotinamide) nucleotide adenylyltransferase